jgi:hypothetical protein
MRKLAITFIATAAILSTGSLTWKADALGIARLGAAENAAIEKVACWPGERNYCRYHFKPGRWGGCVPCRHGPGY